jgi:hypothetical protein
MNDTLIAFIACVVITSLLLAIAWNTSASNIGADCEKLGSFYVDNKTYKCELVK